MNWSLIIFGLVALSSVTFAKDSYLVIVPKLFKVDYDNQLSIFIASASKPVEVKFDLTLGSKRLESKIVCQAGETRNATLTLPKEFPIGAAELTITGTGGIQFEEKRDVIIYDNRHALLVQTSASSYRPHDIMEIRVVAMTEEFMPLENGELDIEIYDGDLKLVGEFPRVPIRSGLTETLRFPFAEEINVGSWLVSASMGNTTSSVEVLVTRPVTPSFDLKAIFQRFLLRSDKVLRGVLEMTNDRDEPIFGRALVAIGQMTEQEYEMMMMMKKGPAKDEPMKSEEWRKWKSQKFEIAGRFEMNYDLLSTFDIDLSKTIAVQIYIQVTDLLSGQERIVRHTIPVFSRDVIYDIRPLQFEAGIKNEFEVMAKRPDGKPIQMEDVIVTVRMMLGDEQGKKQEEKTVEIKDFYTRGRNDMGLFNIEFPENCIGVLMTVTPVDKEGKVFGYRTMSMPLMPTPRRSAAKLSIELMPSTVAPTNTDVNVPVVSSQISTVGRTSNFYIQLIPSKPVQKFERLPMSYVLMTNGRITRSGEFHIEPTKECREKTARAFKPEEQVPPMCLFNGTLSFPITWEMVPYSSLLVYTFQPTFGFNVAETYRFSVAGLFRNALTLNATIVPFTSTETIIDDFASMPHLNVKPLRIADKVQEKSRVELSFTGVPESTVGLNVFEFDGVFQGLSNEITKERVLRYLTTYEHVPVTSMQSMPSMEPMTRREREVDGVPSMMGPSGSMTGFPEGNNPAAHNNMPVDPSMQGGMPAGPAAQGGMPAGPAAQGGMPTGPSGAPSMARRMMSEEEESKMINRERMGYEARYPVEKMIFGVHTGHNLLPVEGDDIYVSSKMGRLYRHAQREESVSMDSERKLDSSISQFDVTVDDNDYVLATSVPLVFAKDAPRKPMPSKTDKEMDVEKESTYDQSAQYGTRTWYERMNSRLNSFTPEAYKFLQSGLSIVSDFDSLRIPAGMKRENLNKLFGRFRKQSAMLLEKPLFDMRDEARELLESYMNEFDYTMTIPPVMLEEQSRASYYRSIFFNTSRIESQGTGKVVLPRTKPYSTWMATGFALNAKSGLSIAQPIRLPTNQGLFVIGNCAKYGRVGEHILLTFGINNYLEKDVSNVLFRIRASADFDLIEQSKPETVISSKDKDYFFTIPQMKSFGVETRNLVLIPKRHGLIQIVLEVESQFGGDYEVLNMFVREAAIERVQLRARLFELTEQKNTFGPIVEKIEEPTTLRSVEFAVSGTFLDKALEKYSVHTKSLVGIDESLVRLYRTLGFRRYLNETSQAESPLFHMLADNITMAYQTLLSYSDYDGSFSFVSGEGTRHSSLYLTALAFGAMNSPYMPFRDYVALNRTLNWILSRQQEDGSFDDNGPCFHYRFCAREFRRESLTAIVLYSLTRDNSSLYMPEFIHRRLFHSDSSPMMRAERYLISRVPEVKPHLLTISLFELAFIQNRQLSSELRGKIHETLLARKLTVDPEDGSKNLKIADKEMTFDDELLANSINIFLYSYFGDYRTAMDMSRWVAEQIEDHPQADTVLDAIFQMDAWYKLHCIFRKQFAMDKFDVTVDVSADNGEKKQFKITPANIYRTQFIHFTMPVREITYSVRGLGLFGVMINQRFTDKQQRKPIEPMPFKLSQEFRPMNWLSEITAKTCFTYTPTPATQRLAKDTYNRTVVIEIELPSGMRINERQIGFFLSRVENVMHFTYNPCFNKLSFFVNVPSTIYGKEICMEWCLERLSSIVSWAPISIRVYDYLQPELELMQLVPIQLQPNLLGYSFVDAVHKARPALSSLPILTKQKEL